MYSNKYIIRIMKGLNIVEGPSVGATHYRVFQLDMTYFEVQDGQLKLTSKFKKR